jgi:hypothetical protein
VFFVLVPPGLCSDGVLSSIHLLGDPGSFFLKLRPFEITNKKVGPFNIRAHGREAKAISFKCERELIKFIQV